MRSTVTRTARNHHSLGAAIFNLLGLFLPGPFVACVDAGRIGHSLYEHTAAKPRSAAVQQYHPLGKVPVLIETMASACKDDAKGSEEAFYLYESAAIVTYLGDWYTTSTTTTTIHVKDGNKEDPCALLVPPAGTRLRGRSNQKFYHHRTRQSRTVGLRQACRHGKRFWIDARRSCGSQGALDQVQRSLGATNTPKWQRGMHCLVWSRGIGWDAADSPADAAILAAYYQRCAARPAFVRLMALREQEGSAFANAAERMG